MSKFCFPVITLFLFSLCFTTVQASWNADSFVAKDWLRQDGKTEADAAYIEACQQRRNDRLKALKQKYPKIVFTKHFDLGGSHYAYTEAQSDAQAERNFHPGSALCLLELGADDEYHERTLLEDENGVIRDPAVTFDGKKIVFAWKKSDRLDDYHLYDYDVETAEVRQLTFGLGYADYEPCPLPNGDIVFNSTRCVQVVDCWWTEVSNLYRCDKDGKFLRRLSFDQVHTNNPALMDDGRIVYTRWDYNDRGQIFPQGLFQMNADGTAQTEYYGNNSWFPTTLMHTRCIPDSGGKSVSIVSGHHNRQYGKLGIIDRTKGRQESSGIQLVAPIRETTDDRIDAWGQWGDRFSHPYPINEREFIVSYNCEYPEPEKPVRTERDRHEYADQHSVKTPFGLYWINVDGERELLAYDAKISCNQPFPLVVQTPVQIRDSTPVLAEDSEGEYGTYTIQDVYFGPGLEGIARGTAKTLRVVALDFRSTGIGSNNNHGPSGGALVSTPVSISQGTWDVKIPLGDVPIEEDGSASFMVPARTPVYFQILDENGHCIQTMRSWSTLQPGETFSCIGCHEDKNVTLQQRKLAMAQRKPPQKLKPPFGNTDGEPRGFSFAREIQPTLDKHCVECHHNDAKEPPYGNKKIAAKPGVTPYQRDNTLKVAEADRKNAFSLKADPVLDMMAKRQWSRAYLNLTNSFVPRENEPYMGRQTPFVNWINVQDVPSMLPPYKAGAAKSDLLKMFDPNLALNEKTHHDVRLSREELNKLAAWIDLLVPFCGDYREANAWNEAELAKFEYYEGKKMQMNEYDRKNLLQFVSYQLEGVVEDRTEETDNSYRNLALNPGASDVKEGETPKSYPAASSNSVCRGDKAYAASNCIDGNLENKGHGGDFPSWGPEQDVKDLWWKVDLGRSVRTDQIAITLRADFPHDTYWKSCTMEMSNGFKQRIDLQKTSDRQVFRFPPQKTEWVKLTEFDIAEPGWAALTEVEVLGVDSTPRSYIAPGTEER